MAKARLSVTVDEELIAAGQARVGTRSVASLSDWVNGALLRQIAQDARQDALDDYLAQYESEFGPITDEDIAETEAWVAEHAIVVEPKPVPQRAS